MSKLIASYLRDSNRRRSWSLVSRQGLSLGYQVAQDQVHVDWDDLIDDLHATVTLENDRLRVVGNSDERPIFFNGISQREFMVVPGEGFVIGLTTFEFEPLLPFGESPVSDITSRTVFRQPDDLRTEMIAASHEELQLVQQFLQSQLRVDHEIQAFEETIATELRRVIRPSDQIAIIRVPDSGEALEMLAARGELSVCEELVRDAVDHYACAEHVWGTRSENASYPAPPDAAWAFCAPIFCERSRYAIYLSGARRSGGKGINSPVRLNPQQQCLVQIVADLYQQGRNVYDLIEWRDQVQEFLPRPVLHLLQRESPKVALRKKITEAAVLFCDLRGSSKFSEQNSKQLDTAWETIKGALGTMTDCIDQQNGVIGDFQGDAAMAFWGWPRSQVEDGLGEDATRACQAADRMRDKFQKKSKDSGSLANFACGIGVAAGPVVAGALGTEDQSKIGVFGP
ncbi:MAG: adenylate/guanylate cyclase domain-containing protein, partial [Pirellulales bacterium]